MRCVSTASFRIRVNGNLTDTIWPSRGLRQRGPISTSFVERLPIDIRYLKAMDQRTKYIHPKIAPRGDRAGRLQFIDDLLIFLNAKRRPLRGYLGPLLHLRKRQVRPLIDPSWPSCFLRVPKEVA